jgi:hypothetical protein
MKTFGLPASADIVNAVFAINLKSRRMPQEIRDLSALAG